MKVLIPILLLIVGYSTTGCLKKVTHFYVDYTTTTTVPATLTASFPFSLMTPELETNSTYEFEDHDTRKDKIQSIFLKTLRLKITQPNGETFSFANSMELFISTDNSNEKKIAGLLEIPDSVGNEIYLSVETIDLQEYIKSDKFKLRLKVITDETIPQDVHIEIYSNFLVDAKLIRSKK